MKVASLGNWGQSGGDEASGDAPRQLEVEEGFNGILFRFWDGEEDAFPLPGPFLSSSPRRLRNNRRQ